ncbi:MAG: hypothetical protein AUI10_01335 [Actinobacteria bacterium 13_2_20CM_2_72_6]|nr:MAG: hypothetical protein AUI10_01335 [Actinobacteria bacterium 13_2_20CM_2_72_6]
MVAPLVNFGGRRTVHSVPLRRMSSSIAARSTYVSRSSAPTNGSRMRRLSQLSSAGTGPAGAALSATNRRTPVSARASRMPRVAVEATGPSLRPRGPIAEITASTPSSAGRSGSGSDRSRAVTTSSAGCASANRAGSRTTAVTLSPAASARRTTCPPTAPVAPNTVILMTTPC